MTLFTPHSPATPAFASTVRYAVTADAHSGALPRVLELFALRGLTPDRVQVSKYKTTSPQNAQLTIDIHVSGLTDQEQEIIRHKLASQVSVQCVRDEVFIGRQKNWQNTPAKLVS